MGKVAVTYHAPKGDDKVAEMFGVTFFDGQTQQLDEDDHGTLLAKAKGNPHFLVGDQTKEDRFADVDKPEKHDLKAGIAGARDHDFEADRRANMDRAGPGSVQGSKDEKPGQTTEPAADMKAEGAKSVDDMNIAELRAEAERRGIDHSDLGKAELKNRLRQ